MPDLDDESPSWVEGLWRTTCFELFVGEPDGHHVEFNFAPDGNWAAYAFSGRRSGMQPITITPGGSRFQPNCDGTLAEFWANIDRRVLPPGEDRLGICAVLEDDEGRISYWALAHPPGKPDFHHPDCFAVKLAEVLQQ